MKILNEEKNVGYLILNKVVYTCDDEYESGSEGWVIGYNKNRPAPYVVWDWTPNRGGNYFNGSYFETAKDANKEFYNRVEDFLQYRLRSK